MKEQHSLQLETTRLLAITLLAVGKLGWGIIKHLDLMVPLYQRIGVNRNE